MVQTLHRSTSKFLPGQWWASHARSVETAVGSLNLDLVPGSRSSVPSSPVLLDSGHCSHQPRDHEAPGRPLHPHGRALCRCQFRSQERTPESGRFLIEPALWWVILSPARGSGQCPEHREGGLGQGVVARRLVVLNALTT